MPSVRRARPVLSVVAIAIILRLQWEFAFSLEEKPDRIACHPTLWLLERKDVMDLAGKHLFPIGNQGR